MHTCYNLASAIILSNVSASMLHQVLHMMTVMAHGNLIFLDVGLGILEGNQMRYAAWEILQTECQGYDIHLIKIDQFNQAWFSIHTFALEMPSNVSNIFNLLKYIRQLCWAWSIPRNILPMCLCTIRNHNKLVNPVSVSWREENIRDIDAESNRLLVH